MKKSTGIDWGTAVLTAIFHSQHYISIISATDTDKQLASIVKNVRMLLGTGPFW